MNYIDPSPNGLTLSTVRRPPEGDWRWSVTSKDGRRVEFDCDPDADVAELFAYGRVALSAEEASL